MQQFAAPAPPDPLATLTERERAVLCLLGAGRSNKEIAATLHLTTGTVKGYVSIILGKLDVADRTQAALYAVRHGLVPAG
jgi:DNA-binding NarL/FixJ family response regulator